MMSKYYFSQLPAPLAGEEEKEKGKGEGGPHRGEERKRTGRRGRQPELN